MSKNEMPQKCFLKFFLGGWNFLWFLFLICNYVLVLPVETPDLNFGDQHLGLYSEASLQRGFKFVSRRLGAHSTGSELALLKAGIT